MFIRRGLFLFSRLNRLFIFFILANLIPASIRGAQSHNFYGTHTLMQVTLFRKMFPCFLRVEARSGAVTVVCKRTTTSDLIQIKGEYITCLLPICYPCVLGMSSPMRLWSLKHAKALGYMLQTSRQVYV